MSAVQKVAVLLSAFAVQACFDVTKIDPGDGGPCAPLVVDDFENGNLQPTLGQLGPWQCFTYNPEGQAVSCGVGTDSDGTRSLFVQFDVQDPVDGTANTGGAGVETYVTGDTLDLRGYVDLVVGVQLISGTPPLSSSTQLEVSLACNSAPLENASITGLVNVSQQIAVTIGADWTTAHLDLSSFVQPIWMNNRLLGGTSACLAQISGLTFAVTPNLPDGQSAAGTLRIDNLALAPKCPS